MRSITIPDGYDVAVLRKPEMRVVADPSAAVMDALEFGIASPSLAQFAQGKKTACIAVCDITRPVPNHLFLRPIVEVLKLAGISEGDITIIVATGLHRPNEGAELAELIGDPWVMERVRVVNHRARNDAEHVLLGRTSNRGTIVKLDRRFVDADVRIATGLVEPHFMAGYSGGRKVIAPGLAHAETITTFHSARFMSDPAATSCNFTGNPLHEEQLEIVKMLGGSLSVNTVIDEERRLSFINFGEIVASHQQAVDFVREYCEVSVPCQFSTVVTSAAGYPLDQTYYQTIKGMVCAMDILQPGGDLVIYSACSEGMGSAEFVDAQRRLVELGVDGFLTSLLEKSHADIDEWQTQKQIDPMKRGAIHLLTDDLPPEDHNLTGVRVWPANNASLHEILSAKQDRDVAAIPEGPYVVPFYRPNAAKPLC